MNEAEKRKHRCCFTGHRPEKLRMSEKEVKHALRLEINRAVKNGFFTFISGMSRGVDIWAAEQILLLREKNTAIHLICALPFYGFEKQWSTEWKTQYHRILDQADIVRIICPSFSFYSYQRRNEWMVDRSSLLIAVFNGEQGGTKNTIDYAEARGIEVAMIDIQRSSKA